MQDYLQFIKEIKQNILVSRYMAAKLANREQLLLFLRIGKMIHEKAKNATWGAKILDKISADLQHELPRLRDFSAGNLKKIKSFYSEWQPYFVIGLALPNQLQSTENKEFEFCSTLLSQIQANDFSQIGSAVPNQFDELFFGLSFTHHYAIASKTDTIEEKVFYIYEASRRFWSTRVLEKHLSDSLFQQKGKLPNNFAHTLLEKISNKAVRHVSYKLYTCQIFNKQYSINNIQHSIFSFTSNLLYNSFLLVY